MIDRERACRELGGLPVELYDELLGDFKAQTEAVLAELKSAVDSGNQPEVGRLAHGIKGAAANLRVEPVHLAAKDLEMSAKSGRATTDLYQTLIRSFEDFKKEIA